MAIFSFFERGVNITIDARDEADAAERLRRIVADYDAQMDERAAVVDARGVVDVRRDVLVYDDRTPYADANRDAGTPLFYASLPRGVAAYFAGCPMGRGASAYDAAADLLWRVNSENAPRGVQLNIYA